MNKSLLIKTIANTKFSELSIEKLLKLRAVLLEPEETTKICSNCGYNRFAPFSSLGYKQCTGCWTKFEWKLKDKEHPLIKHQR